MDRAVAAIEAFVEHVRTEAGTRLYLSLRDRDDPATFLHVMVFDGETAQDARANSDVVQVFTAALDHCAFSRSGSTDPSRSPELPSSSLDQTTLPPRSSSLTPSAGRCYYCSIMRASLSIVTVTALIATGTACSHLGGSAGDGKLQVVAAFYPVQEAAQVVGGDRVDVTNLTAPGVEPHDLELTPDQVEAIATADVVLYLGDGFQPAVQDAVADARGITVDLLNGMPTVEPPAGSEAGLTVDPHVWLDPKLYERMVAEVEAGLAKASPAGAATFRANADAFTRQISALDDSYRAGLAHCQRTTIVTNHAAFGYLVDEYGLTQDAISGLAPDAEPSAQRLSQLRDLVQRDEITTIFTEDLVSPKVAQTLADEAGVATAVLHTLEGLTDDEVTAGDDYGSQMQENLTTLESALGCS